MSHLAPRIRSGLSNSVIRIGACILLASLSACSSLGSSGPATATVKNATGTPVGSGIIKVLDVTEAVARQAAIDSRGAPFSEALGDLPPEAQVVGRGDVLEVSIWEAPPAVLFGSNATFGAASSSSVLASSAGVGQRTALPEMMVDSDGMIRVPFAGSIQASGRTPREIERQIASRLSRKAHDPQVAVRLITNSNATVTVVGDVSSNTRVPLTPRGERILDVIASAGGVKEPIGKMTVQITRGDQVTSLPLQTVIRDPAQNIRLRAGDIVTALFQPYSFTSLGATGTSAEVPFEGTGLSLSQALGRVGGLKGDQADIRGVFIFRLENPAALDPAIAATARRTADGRVPVIYRVNMRDPASLFIAQTFPIKDRDVLYVSTAPLSDFARFMGIASSMAFTAIGLGQAIPAL